MRGRLKSCRPWCHSRAGDSNKSSSRPHRDAWLYQSSGAPFRETPTVSPRKRSPVARVALSCRRRLGYNGCLEPRARWRRDSGPSTHYGPNDDLGNESDTRHEGLLPRVFFWWVIHRPTTLRNPSAGEARGRFLSASGGIFDPRNAAPLSSASSSSSECRQESRSRFSFSTSLTRFYPAATGGFFSGWPSRWSASRSFPESWATFRASSRSRSRVVCAFV